MEKQIQLPISQMANGAIQEKLDGEFKDVHMKVYQLAHFFLHVKDEKTVILKGLLDTEGHREIA